MIVMKAGEAIEIAPNQLVDRECIENPDCNPMLKLAPKSRVEALGICATNKLGVGCTGSRPGAVSPICGLNNLVKCAIENRTIGNLMGDVSAVRASALDISKLALSEPKLPMSEV